MALAAAALSEHPYPSHAVGECVGHLLERGGERPDVVMLWSTEPIAGALEDVSAATRQLLRPQVLVGCGAAGVLGGEREVDGHAALAMFAAWDVGPTIPVRLDAAGDGLPADASGTLVMWADPFDVDGAALARRLRTTAPALQVVGAMSSGAQHRGGNRLLLDGAQHRDGGVGVLLSDGAPVHALVSQGGHGLGPRMTVTASEGAMVHELAGRPALQQLESVVESLDPVDRERAAQGLLVGRVHDDRPGAEEVALHALLGADRATGALALDDEVPVGATVQFQVWDPGGAHDDLVRVLADRDARAAVVLGCARRARARLGAPDDDAVTIADALGTSVLAGMAGAGVLGPVAGRTTWSERSVVVLALD